MEIHNFGNIPEDADIKGMLENSAVAEHAWKKNTWYKHEVSIIDQAQKKDELFIKEALHINMTLDDKCFNRYVGLELPKCWIFSLGALNVQKEKRRHSNYTAMQERYACLLNYIFEL